MGEAGLLDHCDVWPAAIGTGANAPVAMDRTAELVFVAGDMLEPFGGDMPQRGPLVGTTEDGVTLPFAQNCTLRVSHIRIGACKSR